MGTFHYHNANAHTHTHTDKYINETQKMVAGTLYTYAESYRGYMARIAAEYGSATLKVVEVLPGDKKHPIVPSFVSDDKKVNLVDANAIAYYLANDALRTSSLEDRAAALQWVSYGSTQVESAVTSWVYPVLGLVESSVGQVQRAKQDLKEVFSFLNQHLRTRTYLVGERLSLADLVVACDLLLAYQFVADETFRKSYENLNRWFSTVSQQAQFTKVTGANTLCAKAIEFDAKKFAEVKAKKAAAKPAAAPKAAKAAKPAAAGNDEEEADSVLAAEPKSVDPFAAMPKGSMNMDEFKREYSNKDTYSTWFMEYKYADELGAIFMSSNLIGGMFQRIEKLRKNAFASIGVFGENKNNTIAGVWFWKGQELVFPLCPDWTTDYESYEWTKLNPDDAATKKIVDDMFMWEGEVKGKKFADGKIFK